MKSKTNQIRDITLFAEQRTKENVPSNKADNASLYNELERFSQQ